MTTAAQAAHGSEPAARSREAVLAGVIGNTLEWFDFAVYGYFVSTISKLFFPSSDPIASLLATYLVFGVGFLMRPVGSIVFGIYGDRHGRRKALSAVIFLMALSTLAIRRLAAASAVASIPTRAPTASSSSGVRRDCFPRPPQTWIPSSWRNGASPRLSAPITLVVMPEECQSIPITAPNDWNQNGCARRRSSSSRP